MNAHDLPGIGDRATWGRRAGLPGSPDFDDGDAPDTKAENLEALSEWHESFQSAAALKDWRRMKQARLFIASLMDGLIEEAR